MSGPPSISCGSLFSGIGGLDLGLENAGIEILWQCESDPYCRNILHRHWPDIPCFTNVKKIGRDVEPVDLLCGGFPCQSVSSAGRRTGERDERWLWPEFHRVIELLRPEWVLIENVQGLRTRGLQSVLEGLAGSGYDAEWDCLPASAFGAPHLRYRLFIVAYPGGELSRGERPRVFKDGWWDHFEGSDYIASHAAISRQERLPRAKFKKRKITVTRAGITHGRSWPLEPRVDRMAYGVPYFMERTRALGNAVVPRVAEWIGHRIIEASI